MGFKIFNDKTFSPYSLKIDKIKIGDGISIKIGIISDFQLNINSNNTYEKYYGNNVYKALKIFKNKKIDLLLIVGDITTDGESINYLYFKKIFYSVYYNIQQPIVISLMGNHDYKDMNHTKLENQKIFYDYMNSYPYSHFIINKFNFIFWSNDKDSLTDSSIEDYIWIKSTLEKARKNIYRKGDPIFVLSHFPPMGTVYGSENISESKGIFNILKDYPEVICISGHSHYSLRNIKSIWQGEFTVINTQSLSFIDIDKFYVNAKDIKKDSVKNDSMGLIAFLTEDKVIFDRIEFSTEEFMEESWVIDFPINTSNFKYKFDLRNNSNKPFFNDKNGIKIEKKVSKKKIKNYIIFNAAFHEKYVYAYKIILKGIDNNNRNNKEFYYYSDYYKNKKLRKELLQYQLPNDLDTGKYEVKIYALDSFGIESIPKYGYIDI